MRGELKSPLNIQRESLSGPVVKKKKKKILARMGKLVESPKMNSTMYYHLIYIYHRLETWKDKIYITRDLRVMKMVNHFKLN